MTTSRPEHGFQLGRPRALCTDTGRQQRTIGAQQIDPQTGDCLPDGGADNQPDAAESTLTASSGVGCGDPLHDFRGHGPLAADGVLDGGPFGIGGQSQDEDAPPSRLCQVKCGGEGAIAQVGRDRDGVGGQGRAVGQVGRA